MIKVRIPQKGEEIEVPGPRLVSDILARTGHRPGSVLVRQGKALLTRDRRVEDGSEIEIVSVVSGG
jgi:sulfur carrier protein ThiS